MTSEERREARQKRRKAKRQSKLLEVNKTYEEVLTYENLYLAYRKCLLGISWKPSAQKVKAQAPVYIYDIYKSLHSGKYRLSDYKEFDIHLRGKTRHIQSLDFKDRVVQKCISDNLLIPAITRSFIYDNGACMKDKGIVFSRNRLKEHLHTFVKDGVDGYVLQFDFKKYFPSLDHNIIKALVRKYVLDQKILTMIDDFIDSFEEGLGLGSEWSYLFALMVGNELDHYIKEQLRCKYYGRYMDDGYLLCRDKETAKAYLDGMKIKCEELHLRLNMKKTHIVKLTRGFTFLKRKYRVTPSGAIIITPRAEAFTKEKRKLRKLEKLFIEGKITEQDVSQSYISWRSSLLGTRCYYRLKKFNMDINRFW